MAEIVITGPVSGRRYGFEVAGDSPTVDEQLWIDGRVKQYEGQFADEFEASKGVRPAGAERNFLEYLGEFPKGIARGAVGMGESAALGLASLLPEEYELPTREAIRRGGYALSPQTDIGYEDTISGNFGQALGSFVPLAAATVLPGGQVLAPAMAVGAGAGQASERARAAGATQEERNQTLLPGAVVGAAELLPIKFIKALGRGDTLSITQRISRAAATGGVEGAQEAAAEAAQNLIAKGIYDPDQGVFTNTGESAGYGAGVGGLIQGLLDLAIPGKTRGGAAPAPAETPAETPAGSPQDLPTLAPEEEQGVLFPDAADQRAPDPMLLTPDQRVRPGEQLELPIAQPRVLEPQERVDAQREMELYRPEGVQADLFSQAPPIGRPATEVMDELNIAPRAPIRKRMAAALDTDSQFLEQLAKYSRMPGVEKETRTAIDAYLERQAPKVEAPVEQTPEPAESAQPEPQRAETDGVPDAPRDDQGGAGADVPSPAQRVGDGGLGEGGRNDTTGTPTPDVAELGASRVPAPEPAASAGVQPAAVVPEEPTAEAPATPAFDRNATPGQVTGAPGQVIPEGIRPEQGRTLDSQASAQREPIARQLAAKAKLEAEAADIKALLASRRKMSSEAKATGTKRSALERQLRKRLNNANSQLYNVTSYLRSEAGRQQAVEEGTSNAVNMMTAAENDALRAQLVDWHSQNAPPEVQAFDADVRGDTTGASNVAAQAAQRDPTTVPDKRALLDLLNRTKQQLRSDAQARAAYAYFSKTRDVADALDNIAFDAGSPDVPKRLIGTKAAPLDPYYKGTGKDAANKASAWVEANLSDDSVAYMDEKIAEYVGYNADTVAKVMDKETMTRVERDKAETAFLKTYTDAEAALQDSAAFEGATPEAMTREELRALDSEVMGTDIDFAEIGIDLGNALRGNKRRSIAFGLEAALHPAIVKALRNGNMRAALRGIAATNADPYIQNLASKLVDYVGTTKVFTTATDPDIKRLLTDQKNGEVAQGLYILMDKADYDRVAGESSTQYADQLQNSILIDESTGFNTHTILHEMVHAATATEIKANPGGPFARRMQSLLDGAVAAVGPEFKARNEELPYGFDNVFEFVAEAQTNQEFQQVLSRIFPNKKRSSALTQFARNIFNFVRAKVLGRPAKNYEGPGDISMFDEVDYLTQSVFSLAPEYAAEVSLFGDAMNPLRAREKFDVMAGRAKDFTAVDGEKWRTYMSDGAIPRGIRTVTANLFMPVRNLTESAKKYFPNADDVYLSITKQRELEEQLNTLVSTSLEKTSAFLEANPQLEGLFHSFRTRASRYEIDVRKPRSFYDKFVMSYYTLDSEGTPVDRKFESFDSFEARKGRIDEINAAEKAGARTTKARKVNDPDQDTLTVYDSLRKDYDQLTREGGSAFQGEYNRMLGLPEALQKEAASAVKDQIDAMLPGVENAASRNIILRGIYNKIFSEKGLVAYQSLLRSGDFKVTYTGINPDTNTTETFSHGFKTAAQAKRAAELLGQLPPEYNINGVQVSRRGPADKFNKKTVPPTFVSDVTSLIDTAMQSRAKQAAKAVLDQGGTQAEADAARATSLQGGKALGAELNEQIVELALNALPETSIFQSYRARTGVSGFKGDLSPLRTAMEELNPEGVDILDDPKETRILTQDKMQSLARQVAGIRQRASSARVSSDLKAQMETLVNTLPENEYQQALVYYDALTTAVNNPAVRRSNLISNVNTGAFVATLWGNVSSVVMNLMSIPTVVYPRLAATYGSVKAAKMIYQSFGVIMSSGRTRMSPTIDANGEVSVESTDAGFFGVSLKNRTFGDVDTTAGYKTGENSTNVLKYLVEEGTRRHMFVDSVLYDYLEMNNTGLGNIASKMLHAGAAPMHHSERYMRETTMAAAYMLELDKIATATGTDVLTEAQMREAAKTAAYETERMTGTIPAAGSPNWALKGVMPAVFMFKRYPLAIVNMLVQDGKRSFPNKRELIEKFGEGSPEFENAMENRKIARLQLAAVLGSMGLWAGAAGMPMYGAISDIFDAAFTDDDEENFDVLVRRGIGELGYKGLGNYLFGVEMSSRIGLNGIFYREPLRADDQPPLWNLIEGAGGPAVSLAHGWTTRSRDLWNQGETYRAMESALPASMRNVLRSYRFATTGGADSLRDDIIADIGPGQAVAQLFGFAPSTYIRQLELNSAAKTIDSGINSRRTRLLRRLNIAKRQSDTDEIRDVMQDIQRFNADHPYNSISNETIDRSEKTFENTSERVVRGIVYTDRNRPAIKDLIEMMEPDS